MTEEKIEETPESGDSEDIELTVEDVVEENNLVLNTLIDLLIEKKVISEEEFVKKLNSAEEEIKEE